ncbi:MAG: crossover junction endodeoxyribonuclease RuvC [Thermoguttaceae bacterium]|nr:crossover junction endodeoxyribonuclease RuvC [Thermoguttaceae bacterium]
MKVLGIDPGLGVTGYAVIERVDGKIQLLEAGVIRGRSKKTLPERIHEIYVGLEEIVNQFKPDAMGLEELYSFYKRPRTAILMGHARGAIILAAANAGIPVYSYSATRIKKVVTGSGQATKSQMQRAIMREFNLTEIPKPPDVADALGIALTCLYLLKPRVPNLKDILNNIGH